MFCASLLNILRENAPIYLKDEIKYQNTDLITVRISQKVKS